MTQILLLRVCFVCVLVCQVAQLQKGGEEVGSQHRIVGDNIGHMPMLHAQIYIYIYIYIILCNVKFIQPTNPHQRISGGD